MNLSVKIIDRITGSGESGRMSDRPSTRVLVLGATGKTGSRVARLLRERGTSIRMAARTGADIHFDWDAPATFAPTVAGISALYLVAPVMRVDFAPVVSLFLDEAEKAGVEHVTFLSAYGMEHAPEELALRAVELDLARRGAFTHSLIRPAWFMQDFTETFLRPANGEIVVPNGNGAEAFVSAEDIAAVAVATLTDPAHAGAAYAPTGPASLTMAEAAAIISDASGVRISYRDVDRATWVQGMVDAGVPSAYGTVLFQLTETIATGRGARPNDDVLTVTGFAPQDFTDFARRNAGIWNTPEEQMTKYTSDASNFGANGPFYHIIREGLRGLVEGEDYYDLLADDVVVEYVISVPGYPRRVEGRQSVIDLYAGYDDYMNVHTADELRVYHDPDQSVVVLEYAVHGTSVPTGRPYDNHFVSIITVKDNKVVHWRDYLDPIAIFDASGWPDR